MSPYDDPDPTDETLPPREANAPARRSAEPRAGDVVGKYHLDAEIGRGAMGAVFRARAADTGRDVAVKVISSAYAGIQEAHARFEREARAAARTAGHPGIAGVHDLGEVNGLPYLVMELVEGPTLQECLDVERYDDRELVQRVVEAARAVHHAHGQGVLHRDLKPGNILVAVDGTVRVTDFGLASMALSGADLTRLTAEGRAVGTPAFMPPEQARGGSCDARSDVYSLGATLFHCLAGRAPIAEGTVPEMVQRVVDGARMPLLQARPDVAPELAAVVERALSTQPAGRYPTAAAFADDLERWLAGTAVEAPEAAAPPARPPTPAAVWWLAGAGAAAVAIAWGVWWFSAATGQGATEVARAREATEAAQRSTADHEALAALALRTVEPLALLMDRFHGAPVTDVETRAAEEEIIAAAVEAGGAPARAWAAFARWLVTHPEGEDSITTLQAEAESPEAVEARILLVRVRLLQYAALLKAPAHRASVISAMARPLEETPARLTARTALRDAARALPVETEDARVPVLRALAAGVDAFAGQDYGGAEGLLAEVQDDPLAGPEALLFRGFALHLAQEFGSAARLFEPLAARRWPMGHRMAGRSWLFDAIRRFAAELPPGDSLRHADRTLAEFVTQHPKHPDARYFQGLAYELRAVDAQQRNASPVEAFGRAVASYQTTVALSRNPVHAHLGVARCALSAGRWCREQQRDSRSALTWFQRGWPSCLEVSKSGVPVALELSADTAFYLAACEFETGVDARRAMRLARRLCEAQAEARPTGDSLSKVGRTISMTVQLDVKLTGQAKLEDIAGAGEWFDRAAAVEPDNGRIWGLLANAKMHLGRALQRRKDREGAIAAFRRAIEAHTEEFDRFPSQRPSALRHRGGCRLNLGSLLQQLKRDPVEIFQGAIADFDAALKLRPDGAELWMLKAAAHHGLGIDAERAGKTEAALEQFRIAEEGYERAMRLDPALTAKLTPELKKVRRRTEKR